MMLVHGSPSRFGSSERIELDEFLRRSMVRATVVMDGCHYDHADTWTLEWRAGRIAGFSAHRLLRGRQFDVMHIMATYCESGGLRRSLGPMVLQRPAFRELRSDRPVYWCLRTRNPLVVRTLGLFSTVLTRELDIAPTLLAARCFGSRVRLDRGGRLHHSYPEGSVFLPAPSGALGEIDYQRNQCLFLAGRVNLPAVPRSNRDQEPHHAVLR
ncbi:MAG: hypothetical protein KJO07_25065 [Deltaproteobacteria bacterium]|nr:hypothetical protein [Deltaproteobacteria bacterium]